MSTSSRWQTRPCSKAFRPPMSQAFVSKRISRRRLQVGLGSFRGWLQSSQRERIKESALLRALGASHAQVRRAVLSEFAILGGLAG